MHCSFSQFSKVYCIEKMFNPSELIKNHKRRQKVCTQKVFQFLTQQKKTLTSENSHLFPNWFTKLVINNFNYTKCSTSCTYFSLSSTTKLYKNNYFELLNNSFIKDNRKTQRVLYIYFSLYTCGVLVFPVWFVYHRVLTTHY